MLTSNNRLLDGQSELSSKGKQRNEEEGKG